MHQSNHTPEQRGVDVYLFGAIYQGVDTSKEEWLYIDGMRPGCMCDDCNLVWNYLKTLPHYIVAATHYFKDGEDVTGRYELGYQVKTINNTRQMDWTDIPKGEYDSLNNQHIRRIVAIAIELDEEEHNIVFEGSNRYCSCGHPECTRYQPLPTPGQEGEADGWKYDYKFLSQLTEKVNELEFGEGLGMEEVESVLLSINYKHPEQVANEVSNWLFLKTGLDIEKIIDCKLFLQKVLTTPAP